MAAMGSAALLGAGVAGCGPEQCYRSRPGEEPAANECRRFPGLDPGTGAREVVVVSGDITRDTHWRADTAYVLRDFAFVRAPATLTIEPGTVVRGERGSALVITRGARIHAEGTAENPIVFTSAKPAGARYRGDWGGLMLLGAAPINVAGGENVLPGVPIAEGRGAYGGADPEDSSGVLRYVRVEFGGYALTPDTKLNGLTCAGCGRRTVLDYIQVHRAADDGLEIFGGTVDVKHVVLTFAYDDGLDWDMGWQGRAQFVVVAQEPANGEALYEADNSRDNHSAEPRSEPTIYNATLVGSRVGPEATAQVQRAMVLRRGTGARLYNHVVIGASAAAIDVRDRTTFGLAASGDLFVRQSIFFENGGDGLGFLPRTEAFDALAFFTQSSLGNRVGVDPMLERPYDRTAPSWMPLAGSPVFSSGVAPPDDGFFDPRADFVGAFGTEDWTAGWTAYPLD
jgi:hypothetical protein